MKEKSGWKMNPLHLKAKSHAAPTLKEWIIDLVDVLCADQIDFLFMALWSIWTERNKLIWERGTFQPMHMISWCVNSLTEFQKYHPKATRKKKRPLTKWECPPLGRLKINIDNAFRVENGAGGIGVVIRDELGIGLAAIARPFLHAHSAINMEAEACRAGLFLGMHQGWTNIDIESDSTLLIAALNSKEENLLEVSRVLDDCRDYMSAFQSVRVQHNYREANGVANRLAHLASLFSIYDVWLDETPANQPNETPANQTFYRMILNFGRTTGRY
ncbi:uncharacterized protein LOC133716573 [Rosa rugosa]|uniref:uncharacterized protein LOC133716573 n=1 Tax=Rosa rugosa TaxID=74645 RepID=UPI002B410E68|nr:uncharacterized protein LOC133716573 [Rosa rugosa]